MASKIFPEPEVGSFVTSLSRWLSGAPVAQAPKEGEPPREPSALEKACAELDQKGSKQELADKLFAAFLERLPAAKEADARNAFGIYLELLVQWQRLAASAEPVATQLAAKPAELAELKGSLLLALYAAVQQHGMLELRFTLLLTLVRFCSASNSLSKVLGPLDGRVARVERWVTEWELTGAQQKQLWALVFDAHPDDDRVLHECALKYFALHEAADFKASAELRARIVKAVLTTIRSPSLFRCDELSQSVVVRQLESDAELAPLHKLLHIMARDTYAEFLAFAKAEASVSFMKKHELPVEACGDKMRLLTLVSLGHANKELSYDAVSTALSVEHGDVEKWVMLAIGNGLITAKMDQVREVVAVSMCAERDFGLKQWERLHTSLIDWRDSIHSLLDVLSKSRPA